ncbi:MAG: response regulator [Lachnospiraceae bacterium]|nr:response regulator [Lachnospiraceae bacterium]
MKKNSAIITIIAVLLIAVVSMDIFVVFGITREQTRTSGSYQLQSVSGALETTLNEAINTTMGIAIEMREYIDDRYEVAAFLRRKKNQIIENNTGYNVYMADADWDYIPDLIAPEGYVAQERLWYTGAIKNNGVPYVSPPYIDALTNDICFTVSVMLGDKETVIAIDYTLDSIQAHIKKLHSTESTNAVIVTDEGIIAGSTDPDHIGKKLIEALPDYAGIYALCKNKSGVVTGRIKDGMLHENLFATRNGNGWYLIVSESEWELYHSSYIQLALTIFLSVALFTVIIVLYILATRSRKRAESALSARDEFISGITGELKAPLNRILEISARESASAGESSEGEFAKIQEAGRNLNEKLGQIISYKSILRTEKSQQRNLFSLRKFGMNNKFRALIIIVMVIVMGISVYTNIYTTYQLGFAKMQSEAGDYRDKLDSWVYEQKSKLDMFCSFFSINPDMLDDYEGTVRFLNNITEQYPEISASYITNPERVHTVYMNNGWEPDPDKPVQDRPWYIALTQSDRGWIVTTPYFDQQTGGYCVTLAETVLDSKTGEFVGNFGIDFYMDSLVNILGDSYSDTGYAFLVDADGDIINHPYGKYQMTADTCTNISDLPYNGIYDDASSIDLITDYDSGKKLLIAIRSINTDFSIYVVKNFLSVYGSMLIYDLVCMIAFIICIILVYRTLGNMIRWQEMTNAKMKEAADVAIAADKSKNQFLAQMSHEIRTPINAVLGMNEMILREADSESIKDYSLNIKSSGRNLLALINSILDFSKIEDGKMEIIPAKYDLASMINNLVNSIDERAKAKSLRFNVDVDPGLPSLLFGDDVRISQVITNLLTNAVKYTHEGSVTLTLKDGGREGDCVKMFVSVKDTGIGIKSADMKKLFESFERIEEIRNRNIEGTGLGMSIVTKLLSMMNSELHVDSIYGVGSEFSFTINQKILSEDSIGNYSERLRRISEKENTASKTLFAENAHILVVDDNDMNLKVARNLLKLSNIKPDLASSGAECIELMKKNKYDLVLMDHMMPVMDGIETLSRLKEEKLIPDDTHVIVLTANAVVGAKEKYLAAGFDDYLSKPIEVEELQSKLSAHLPAELVEWRDSSEAEEEASAPAANVAVTPSKKSDAEDATRIPASADKEKAGDATGIPSSADKEKAGDATGIPSSADTGSSFINFASPTSIPGSDRQSGITEVFDFAPSGGSDDDDILEFGPTNEDIMEFGPTSDDPDLDALPTSLTAEMKSMLEKSGIDINEGLRFCGREESFYIEMLDNYRTSAQTKGGLLEDYFRDEKWSDYQILVHSIKSTSKTIGSEKAFTLAKELEEASGEGNYDFVNANHRRFMELYRQLAADINAAIR